MTAVAAVLPTPSQHARTARGWIQSPLFDLALFTLSPLSGLVVVIAVLHSPWGMPLLAAATYLVAIPHYLSSFSFYLGDDNRAYYRTRRAAFLLGPLAITSAVLGLRLWGADALLQSTMFVWNMYHVSLQSAGILSIYRRLNGGPDSERRFAHPAILAVNAVMALWYLERFPPLYDLVAAVDVSAPGLLKWLCFAAAVIALLRLARALHRRPVGLSSPESAFLLTSLLLFHPYLWVEDSNLATFGMLMGHFLQYLAIVWLLHGRKYAGRGGSVAQRALGTLSGRTPLLLATLAGSGLLIYALEKTARAAGLPMAYVVFWNALTLVHFYLDGLIWAFKRPFVRESIGPYLSPYAREAIS
jgi:hypothetical protein